VALYGAVAEWRSRPNQSIQITPADAPPVGRGAVGPVAFAGEGLYAGATCDPTGGHRVKVEIPFTAKAVS
jgi:hypothetical protein